MSQPYFSIVIPVFNRAWSVGRAVESAIAFSRHVQPAEIVLVDDASSDNSVEVVKALIAHHEHDPAISFRFVAHQMNRGVCAAKNTGAKTASGKWLVFLDSDDELIGEAAESVKRVLDANDAYPLHFFRCIDEDSKFSLRDNISELRGFDSYFNKGTDGEALPIAKRTIFLSHLYDEDLRGYESLAYLRLVRKFSAAVLNSLVVRRYYTSHEERLSSKRGMASRYRDLAIGNLRVLKEHGLHMKPHAFAKQCIRYMKYRVLWQFSS